MPLSGVARDGFAMERRMTLSSVTSAWKMLCVDSAMAGVSMYVPKGANAVGVPAFSA